MTAWNVNKPSLLLHEVLKPFAKFLVDEHLLQLQAGVGRNVQYKCSFQQHLKQDDSFDSCEKKGNSKSILRAVF